MLGLTKFTILFRAVLCMSIIMVFTRPSSATTSNEFLAGVCVPFGQGKGNPQEDLNAITHFGFNSIRAEILWRDVEHQPGQLRVPSRGDDFINYTIKAGVSPLLILDYGNPLYDSGNKPTSPAGIGAFARYAGFMAHHFRGRVKLYEVWNEWDGDTGKTTPGKAADYVKLLRAAHDQIKAEDPEAVIIGGAMGAGALRSNFLDEEIEAGMVPLVDGVAVHPYTYWEADPTNRAAVGWQRLAATAETKLRNANHGHDIPLYVTEISWPTTAGTRITENVSAAYLAQTFLLARSLSYVKGLWWYDFTDDGSDPKANEQNFGLRKADGQTPKAALTAYTQIAEVVRNGSFLSVEPTPDKSVTSLKFRMPDGRETLAIWTSLPFSKDVQLAKGNGPAKERQVLKPTIQTHQGADPKVTIDRSGMPTLVDGNQMKITTVQDHH